ncbi:MAG: MBOAT family protein, partial [Ruminococcus sp.]|nr:MBOAT family protein [Ruminococcus sp.]
MVFSSINFIFTFLPIFLIAYYFTPAKFKNAVLLTGSIVFYALGDKYYTFLLIGSLLVNYLLGRAIGDNSQYPSKRKMWFVIAMIFNFGMLVFFKYTNFLIENINILLNTFSIGSLPKVNIVSPLGISFYVFQIVSYIADVYMGKQKAVYNIVNLGTYLCMFPRITMGPIIQYSEQAMELRTKKISILSLEDGLKTFIIGLGSKVLLANPMGTLWAGMSRYGYESISSPYAWLGAFAYSFQIYFDFAGYSLMAMGLGKMIGFTIPQNFNHPYISGSISEFWRRWHMTLGRWFKNYLYFPLGGSRCSKAKMIRNTFIVWAFTGLWHGASWNFVLWG